MSARLLASVGAAVLILQAFTACSSASDLAPEPSPQLPPLAAAVWHVHTAEGQPLPALVAHSLVHGDLVQEFLDSAQLQITSDGQWSRRLWLSRYRNQLFDVHAPTQDVGTWTASDTAYVFTTVPGGEVFSIPDLTPGRVISLPLRAISKGYIEATVRTVRPTEPVQGIYSASTVRGATLPAAYQIFNDFVENGRELSIHFIVDSTRLALFGNRRYEHTVHYSEWEGVKDGPPTQRRHRWVHNDFGQWTRENTLISFESGWLQNHRFSGTVYNRDAMELLHGLAHGDPAVPVGYRRKASP